MHAQLGTWAYARALLITLALCSQCVEAIPSSALSRRMLARPEGQRAIGWIGGAVETFGGDGSPRRIRRAMISTSRAVVRARNAVLAPVRPLLKLTGNRQRWFLFSSSSDITHRLRIEGRERASGAWVILYRARREDRLHLTGALAYRRVRGIYNPSASRGVRPQYEGFVDWLASRVLRSHPEYDGVRVSMERLALATRTEPSRFLGIDYTVERMREQPR